jgi:nucleotide-binding universal stress UspA family protein
LNRVTDPVYRRIVVGFNGSARAYDALALGSMLARPTGARLLITYVSEHEPPFERQTREHARALRERIEPMLAAGMEAVPEGVAAEHTTLESSSPSRGLHELAEGSRSDLLVIGSTHKGPLGRVVVGSVGELLLGGTPCPIAVAPNGFAEDCPHSPRLVCVGYDGSRESRAALAAAHALASVAGAALRTVLVEHSFLHFDRRGSSAEEELHEALEAANAEAETVVLHGEPAGKLVEASEDSDVLVVGSRGYGPIHHVLVGSVSAKLMRSSRCPLLVVPRPALAAHPTAAAEAGSAVTTE